MAKACSMEFVNSLLVLSLILGTITDDVNAKSPYVGKVICFRSYTDPKYIGLKDNSRLRISTPSGQSSWFEIREGFDDGADTVSFHLESEGQFLYGKTDGGREIRTSSNNNKDEASFLILENYNGVQGAIAIQSAYDTDVFVKIKHTGTSDTILAAFDPDFSYFTFMIKDKVSSELSESLYFGIPDATSVVIGWEDSSLISSCETVRVYYKQADVDGSTYSSPIEANKNDYGAEVTGLTEQTFYEIAVEFENATGDILKPYPTYIMTSASGQRSKGVYNLILKATPTSAWALYGNEMWGFIRNEQLRYENFVHSGLDGKDVITEYKNQRYHNFLFGMRENGSSIKWMLMSSDYLSYHEVINNRKDFKNEYDDVVSAFELDVSGYVNPETKSGVYHGFHSTHYFYYGIAALDSDVFAFGLGLLDEPYVGIYEEGGDERRVPMYGYLFGLAAETGSSSHFECIFDNDDGCGYGAWTAVHDSCIFSHPDWIHKFCPLPESNSSCHVKEFCNFPAPENFRNQSISSDVINLQWDLYNSSNLIVPSSFAWFYIDYKVVDTNVEAISQCDGIDSTQCSVNGLQAYTNYSFTLYGYSHYGGVYGEKTEPIYARTLPGVPSTYPNFRSLETINSSCIYVEWSPVDEWNLLGPLVGYQLSYVKFTGNGEHEGVIELGKVENYTICGLQTYRSYKISIRVRNTHEIGPAGSQNVVTAAGVPSVAPEMDLMNSYALTKNQIQVAWEALNGLLDWAGKLGNYYVFFREVNHVHFKNVSDLGTEAILEDLNPYTLYEICLAAANTVGVGVHGNITKIRTLEDVPLVSALNLRGEAINSSSINVSWHEVDETLRRGVVLNYTVYCSKADDENDVFIQVVEGNQFNVVFGGLESYTLYEVKIYSNNSVGAGPYTNTSFIQTTFGVPKDYPLITDSQNTSSTSLYVRWNNVSLFGWGGLIGKFLVTAISVEDPSDSHELLVDYEESTSFEGHISGLKVFTAYNVSIILQNDVGDGPPSPPYSVLTDEGLPLVGANITDASEISANSINIEWTPIVNDLWHGYPHVYNVTYQKVGSTERGSTLFSHTLNEGEIQGLESYTDYQFTIHAGTVKGFGPPGNGVVQKTGEDYPIGSAQNASGTFIDSSSIVVYWSTVKEDEQKGPILSYTITCYSTDFLQNFGSITVAENEDKRAEFSGLEVYTLYAVNISATNSIGKGPDVSIFVRTEGEEPVIPPQNIHGHNTSESSIKIFWQDLELVEWAGYLGDFRVEITNSKDLSDQNVTNITRGIPSGEFMYEFHNLLPYTIYQIRMVAFNFKGDSPFSEIIEIQTAETAPSASPPEVSVITTSFSSISITWGDIADDELLHGVRRGCYVYVQPVYSDEELEIGSTVESSRKRRSTSSSQTYTEGLALNETTIDVPYGNNFNASGLRGNTLYNVSVAFYTITAGVPSDPVQIRTPESVPTISVMNFVCTPISYNSIMLTWQHAPPAYMQGVRTKYTVFYERNGLVLNDTLNPYKEHYEVMFLKSDSEYSFWIVAATAVGYGNQSERLTCMTFETEPTAAPTNVTASSFESPYSSLIEWVHIPDQNWEGSKVGYIIFYQKEATGDVEESYPRYFETFETGYQTSVELTGLEVYARYRIQVAARTNIGYGPKSDFVFFETCHVPHPNLIMHYAVYPPYIDYPVNESVNKPEGIMVNLAEKAVLHCAHHCKSFNRSVNVTYVNTEVPYFANITDLQYNGSVLQIPRRDPGKFTPSHSRIGIANSPGFVLIEVPDSPTEAAAKGEESLLDGIIATIPLCGFYLILNWLFGAIFWFCEPTEVEHKGQLMSLGGLFEGLYLAFMTSTTVGYGDKIPMTNRGRVYIIFWTLLGLVITGIVVGNLSSALSSGAINALAQKLPDDKVLALYGTTEYTYGKKSIKKFDKNVSYYTYQEVLAPLGRKDVKYALIDRNVMEVLKPNITEYGLEVKSVYNFETEFGIAAFGELEKLKICGSKYAKSNLDILSKDMSAMLEKLAKLQAARKVAGGSSEETEESSTEEESAPSYISWQAPLYQQTLLYLVIMWVVFNVVGICYEIHRRYKLMKLRRTVNTESDFKLAFQEDLRKLKCEVVESFQELIERMEDMTEEMLYKHGKQLVAMRNEMSKLYGVNFKYIKTSDLGMPLEKILEYREDIKNRPKEKINIGRVISRKTVTIRHYVGSIYRWFSG